MKPLNIGITCGDINGIGLEVIIKSIGLRQHDAEKFRFILYGSAKALTHHRNLITHESVNFQTAQHPGEAQPNMINVINCWTDNVQINMGSPSGESGKCAMLALERAVQDLRDEKIDALVTAPIHKAAMKLAGFEHIGHTDYLAKVFQIKERLMLLVSDDLRVGVVTEHVPLAQAPQLLNKDLILRKIALMSETLRVDFGIDRPMIAVLGLNPHAGDGGLIGKEDDQIVAPAIRAAKDKGMLAFGPFPADGFFGSGQFAKFHGILAMYHDQGLIPFKTLTFGVGVNYTAGLPVVRTSPDHGVAYDIAGKGQANESSMLKAIYLATDIVRNRQEYIDMRADSLERRKQKTLVSETGEDEELPTILPE
ncbi:MAG: 4-hydroxythreonine-4-phosphate dehydrogenase PdxA [Saprospiraceae bacterium]